MPKWTPGPWELLKNDSKMVMASNNGGCVCQTYDNVSSINTDEGINNARLIAKAPEMYKALDKVQDGAEELCDECSPGPCVGCWVTNIRDLLKEIDDDSG